jgi:hypothetical protein
MIGWDDEKFSQLVEESKSVASDDEPDTFDEDRQKMVALKSDLSNIFVDAIAKNLSEFIQKDMQYRDTRGNPTLLQKKGEDGQTEDNSKNHDTPTLYHLITETMKYHRDSYLVGSTYAAIERLRRSGRCNEDQNLNRPEDFTWNNISIKEESLACLHLQDLVTWFVPSIAMMNLVRPTVVWTVSPPLRMSSTLYQGGPLYTPLVQTMTNLIPLSQKMVDQTLKESVLYFLKSPETRLWVKGTTGGYVSQLQKDARL